LNDT
jgi:Ran GTPase-activating protein (RanGAP) involved in mRNA processing and transport